MLHLVPGRQRQSGEVPRKDRPKAHPASRVHPSMYRDGLLGLTERIRSLEADRAALEADLARMRRITWPQRVVRGLVGVLALMLVAGAAGVAGYWRAVAELRDAAHADAREARWRIAELTRRLEEAREETRDTQAGEPPSGGEEVAR